MKIVLLCVWGFSIVKLSFFFFKPVNIQKHIRGEFPLLLRKASKGTKSKF